MENNKQKVALVTGGWFHRLSHIQETSDENGELWASIVCPITMTFHKRTARKFALENASYRSIHEKVETPNILMGLFEEERSDVVIHLAAQAGVRYSIENPRAYLESNINGTFEP